MANLPFLRGNPNLRMELTYKVRAVSIWGLGVEEAQLPILEGIPNSYYELTR